MGNMIIRRYRGSRPRFKLQKLFSSGENGTLLMPWGHSTLYQDSAGTIPAGVGDVVGLIRDQSGNGNDAVQSTTANKPILQQTGGYNEVAFDGLGDYIDLSAVGDLNGSSWTLVVAMDTNGDQQSFLLGNNSGTPWAGIYRSQDFGPLTSPADITSENINIDGVTRNDIVTRDALFSAISGLHTTIYQMNVATAWATPAFGAIGFPDTSWSSAAALRGLLLINRALTGEERTRVHRVFAQKAGMP